MNNMDNDVIKEIKLDERRLEILSKYGKNEYSIGDYEEIIRNYDNLRKKLVEKYSDFFIYVDNKTQYMNRYSKPTKRMPSATLKNLYIERSDYIVHFHENVWTDTDTTNEMTFNLEVMFTNVDRQFNLYMRNGSVRSYIRRSEITKNQKIDIVKLNDAVFDIYEIQKAKKTIDDHISLENFFIQKFLLYIKLCMKLKDQDYISGKMNNFENYVSAKLHADKNEYGYHDITFYLDDYYRPDVRSDNKYTMNSFILYLDANQMIDYISKSEYARKDLLNNRKRFDNNLMKEIVKTNSYKKENIPINTKYKIGDYLVHERFGKGVVVEIQDGIYLTAFPIPYGIKRIAEDNSFVKKA